VSKRYMEDDAEHAAMVEAIRCQREEKQEPTQYVAPDRGQKQLSCYAVAAIRRKGVTSEQVGSVIAVLIWLIKHANPTNGRCDPGIRKLAFETGLGVCTVRRAIKVAEEIGYVSVELRSGASSAYHLDFDAMENDFHEIEEQAKERHKNQPLSRLIVPPISADLPTPITADLLKLKGESLNGKLIHNGLRQPSAADNSQNPKEKKRVFRKRLSLETKFLALRKFALASTLCPTRELASEVQHEHRVGSR
jgi:DNA-binding transcriptional regulator YhcF (GntR family)